MFVIRKIKVLHSLEPLEQWDHELAQLFKDSLHLSVCFLIALRCAVLFRLCCTFPCESESIFSSSKEFYQIPWESDCSVNLNRKEDKIREWWKGRIIITTCTEQGGWAITLWTCFREDCVSNLDRYNGCSNRLFMVFLGLSRQIAG